MKKSKIYSYEYTYKKEYLFNKLNDRKGCYHNYCEGEYLISIKKDNVFWLGVERGGHTGYWYIANVTDQNGKVIVSGRIIYDPDEDGNEKPKTIGDILLFILFSPCILLLNILTVIVDLFMRITRKKQKHLSPADKLDKFMLDYLCCKKI